MVDVYTEWIVCSLIAGASEYERRPCLFSENSILRFIYVFQIQIKDQVDVIQR